MIVVRVAHQDERDLAAGVAQDRLHMLRMALRPGIQHDQPFRRLNQIGVGPEIGHRAGIVRDDPADAGHHRQIGAALRLRFGQKGHVHAPNKVSMHAANAVRWQRRPLPGKAARNDNTAGRITHMAKGLLFMAFDFSTAHADEFHDWYDLEHIPERLRVPGFLNAERWIAEDNPVDPCRDLRPGNPAVLTSPAYRAVAGDNQSPWTKRVTGDVPPDHALRGRATSPRRPDRRPGRRRTAGRIDEHRPGSRSGVHRVVQFRTPSPTRRCPRCPVRAPIPCHRYGFGAPLPRAVSSA